jgi:hypothetical protein
MDFMGPDGGTIATAFGAGCVACWGFVQMMFIGPLKKQLSQLKIECERREEKLSVRIEQLETILLLHGTGPLKQELQKAISEIRLEGKE